jgi:DNA-binding response OmpR family regulator
MAHIVVIDDDPFYRGMIRKILESAAHEVSEAADGGAGLALARERRPALVITDILMPGKDGIETIFELKATLPAIRIIAISGAGLSKGFDFLWTAQRAGADRVLAKPFRTAELCAVVDDVLRLDDPVEFTPSRRG